MDYNFYMEEAIKEAQKAYDIDEVPIGAVIVYNDIIIARAHNLRMSKKNTLYHSEIIAINDACKYVDDWRLEGCTIFVTIEPCTMCAGAILQSRMDKVCFGAYNKKAGACGSVINMMNNENFNHQVEVVQGVLEEECSKLMSDYFKKFRRK